MTDQPSEPLVVQFPSDDFPPPPAFRLAIPSDWEAVPMPDAEMAVRSRVPDAGFHANVVVRVRRIAATEHAADDLARALGNEAARPGVEVVADEVRSDGPTPARRIVIRYLAPDATLLESHHLAVYVPASSHVANIVSAVGTWAAAAPADVRAAVQATVESLMIKAPVGSGVAGGE